MARQMIVVGDTLSPHGGKVISGSSADSVDGKAVARRNDLADCAKHGVNPIAEGDPSMLVNGEPASLEGHHASCGCVLVSVRATLSVG
ncbi:PAAR domain-containing protein [Ralstonia sp. UBA689]|uniref:PAAR domain-containing protein n=1 Tax=Ralstonia sp. UBA689 TaxID=1947373 RepID=UPI0025F4BA32|nr:PAAR domain-containing protein [Ralstonia sp. UBA689]